MLFTQGPGDLLPLGLVVFGVLFRAIDHDGAESAHSLETSVRNNMQLQTVYWLIAAFAVSFFAVVLPYWQIPYAKVSLSSTLYGMGLLVVGVLAASARALWEKRKGDSLLSLFLPPFLYTFFCLIIKNAIRRHWSEWLLFLPLIRYSPRANAQT